jgi:DNA-binding transcriptional regulator YiaG
MDGPELSALRRKAGVTVEALAQAVDLEPSHVDDMEGGRFPITRPAALAMRFVLARM